jgi:lipopolysaccharide transport system ATP-binding protein
MTHSTIIKVESLSKRYLVGHQADTQSHYIALRDVITRGVREFVRKGADMVRGRQIVQGDEIEEFWALKDVSFEVKQGEVLGIIGRNGAGKSTLLKILSRITEPTEGRVTLRGRVACLLEVGTGFHNELSGRENIYLNGAILGMNQREIKRKFDEIVAFAEVEQFLDTPVKRYSSGMYVRLAFSVAAHLDPEILIVDEVLAVGDATFQKKCLGKMEDVAVQKGRTVLFVSHNMPAVLNLCSQAILLNSGTIQARGAPAATVRAYLDDVIEVSKTDLNARIDRLGNGAVRFVRAVFQSDRGAELASIRTGDEVLLLLEYENNLSRDLRNLHISVPIRDLNDNIVCYFSSTVRCNDFDFVPYSKLNRLRIRIPKFQLVPGKYTLTLFAKIGEEIADWIKGATTFEVQPGDYYGTGKLPATDQGLFLPDYSFEHLG